jgi:hypothetical protein
MLPAGLPALRLLQQRTPGQSSAGRERAAVAAAQMPLNRQVQLLLKAAVGAGTRAGTGARSPSPSRQSQLLQQPVMHKHSRRKTRQKTWARRMRGGGTAACCTLLLLLLQLRAAVLPVCDPLPAVVQRRQSQQLGLSSSYSSLCLMDWSCWLERHAFSLSRDDEEEDEQEATGRSAASHTSSCCRPTCATTRTAASGDSGGGDEGRDGHSGDEGRSGRRRRPVGRSAG